MGGRWQAQEDLIITRPELPLFEGASPWYAKWRSGEHAFVPALAEKRGVDLGRPWQSLPEEFRRCVLYGTGEEKVEATVDIPNKKETALMTSIEGNVQNVALTTHPFGAMSIGSAPVSYSMIGRCCDAYVYQIADECSLLLWRTLRGRKALVGM